MKGGDDAFYGFVVPLIRYGTDVEGPQALYLMEDTLDLWAETLKQAPTISPSLLHVFPNLPKLLASTFEHIKVGAPDVGLTNEQFLTGY